MEILVKAAQLFLSLSILVVLHEFGHFFFAKLFKTRVEKFYMFFNPWFELFKIKRGETEYGIGWIPLGGYVKISGMIDESMDKEQMMQPPQPYEFRSKPSWQRLLIMLGGVLVNFLLAMVIYIMITFTWGEEYLPTKNVKYGIECDSLAKSIGLQNGDKIISLDNQEIENFNKIMPSILLDDRKSIQVDRNGEKISIEIPKRIIPILLKGKGFLDVRKPFNPYNITEVAEGTAAQKAGIQVNDRILALNNKVFEFADQFSSELKANKNQTVTITILRNKKVLNLKLAVGNNGILGVFRGINNFDKIFEFKKTEYGFFASIPVGISRGFSTTADYLKQFKLIFSSETKGYESVGGFMRIGSFFPGIWDWHSFWGMTAFLSIILAIMNILPIPALDGGHVLFLIFEMITGRKPSDKFLEYAQIAGMALLFGLLILANANDIYYFFFK